MKLRSTLFAAAGALFLLASAAHAGFAGQNILGPLGPGSVANGNTTGAADSNDGFTSGDHFFFIWTGPDNAWQLNWPGGDLTVTMTGGPIDLDLFLYTPGGYDDSENNSVNPLSEELVFFPSAAAGTYYIVVDSTGDAGPYTLSINDVPEPTSLAGIALVGGGLVIRRRR